MSQRALIFIVFSCLLLINGLKANLFEIGYSILPAKNVYFFNPDTLKTSTDSLKIEEDNSIESEINYEADDSIRLEPENKKVYLYGNAMVHYGDFNLKAAYIEIDNKTNLITAIGVPDSLGNLQGNPEIKDGQTYIVLTKNDGVVYKRLYREKKKSVEPFLFCSDNKAYSPYTVHTADILEIWSFVCSLNIGEYKTHDLNIESVIRFLQSQRVELGK